MRRALGYEELPRDSLAQNCAHEPAESRAFAWFLSGTMLAVNPLDLADTAFAVSSLDVDPFVFCFPPWTYS